MRHKKIFFRVVLSEESKFRNLCDRIDKITFPPISFWPIYIWNNIVALLLEILDVQNGQLNVLPSIYNKLIDLAKDKNSILQHKEDPPLIILVILGFVYLKVWN